MLKLIIILSILIIFFLIICVIFQFTDKKGLPEFINYKPFNCYKCANFWILNFIYGVAIWVTGSWIFLVGNALTILDAIARHIHEKNNTIKIEDIEQWNNGIVTKSDE